MFDHILVICHGNICRSPLAAAMLKRLMPDRNIESAGLQALVGNGADPAAMALAAVDGLDLSGHRARQLREEMLQKADLVLVMSEAQRLSIIEKSPIMAGKVMLFGKWLGETEKGTTGQEIPDPYRKSKEAFVHVHRLLNAAADSWKKRLNPQSQTY
jgi:protein-tyrosine phosphatase